MTSELAQTGRGEVDKGGNILHFLSKQTFNIHEYKNTFVSNSEDINILAQISKAKSLSRVRLFVTPWTAAHQAPQSMGFSRQEYWSGLPFLSPEDLPNSGIKPRSPALQADSLANELRGKPNIISYASTK